MKVFVAGAADALGTQVVWALGWGGGIYQNFGPLRNCYWGKSGPGGAGHHAPGCIGWLDRDSTDTLRRLGPWQVSARVLMRARVSHALFVCSGWDRLWDRGL